MFDYAGFLETLKNTQLSNWGAELAHVLPHSLDATAHGKMESWQAAVNALPQINPSENDLANSVTIGRESDLSPEQHQQLLTHLKVLHPWRKGPFHIFGHHIDTEWHSDWKWDRVKDAVQPLSGRRVLDVGCGNGYFGWRMVGAGAEQVIGIDPSLIFVMQFFAMRKYLAEHNNWVLPLGIEALPAELRAFDTTFSMGVLYHRKSPIDHIFQLRDTLRSGGELVLETLVIDGKLGEVLVPEGRYAQMRNVWFLPSTLTLESWLRKCQFKNIRLVDVSPTTTQEQRSTDWMTFYSLENYLDSADKSKTIEGHPAPVRAVFVADTP
ncbi:MAG: tRNA 5-methoxyuridine(34)/uridine 5-oxyacetic acid(34) synthase CmoB [Anaerolineae bacterium]